MGRFISVILIFGLFFSLSALPALAKEDCAKAAKLSEEARDLVFSNPAAATGKLREAVSYCGNSASLYYNLGIALYQQGRVAEAETQLESALRINPDYAKALNALAYINITKPEGNRKRAETLARQAIALDSSNPQYHNTLEMLTGSVDIPPKTAMKRPDAVAIIIGNRTYKNSMLPPVKYAAQDAAIMKKYLVDALGYDENNIILIKDAAYIDFIKYFGDAGDHKGILYNRTRKDRSDIFVYYAGHGAPDTNTKKAYLVPTDADPAVVKLTGYSLDTLYENLAKLTKEKNTKSMTVVLDSCFSGGSNEGMIISDASPIFIETTSPVFTMKKAVVFSSSKGNQISSWYPEKNHSLFTYFFLKSLKESIEQGKKLTAGDLERTLQGSDSVNDYAWRLYNREQEPQVIGDKNIVLVQ